MDLHRSATGFFPYVSCLTEMPLPVIIQFKIVIVSAGELNLRVIIVEVGEYFTEFSQIKQGIVYRGLLLIDGKIFIHWIKIVRVHPEKMVLQMTGLVPGEVIKWMMGQINRGRLISRCFQIQAERLWPDQGISDPGCQFTRIPFFPVRGDVLKDHVIVRRFQNFPYFGMKSSRSSVQGGSGNVLGQMIGLSIQCKPGFCDSVGHASADRSRSEEHTSE